MVPLACVSFPEVVGGGRLRGSITVGNKVEYVGWDLIMNSPKIKPKKHGYFILFERGETVRILEYAAASLCANVH